MIRFVTAEVNTRDVDIMSHIVDSHHYYLPGFDTLSESQIVEHVDQWITSQLELLEKHPDWIVSYISFSSIAFYAFRVAVKEGRLKPEEFQILFIDKVNELHEPMIDTHGKIFPWPTGMFNTYGKLLDRLL